MELSRKDYNQNNYSGMAPAPGLLANDSYNTDGSLLLCVHIRGASVFLCFSRSANIRTLVQTS